MRKFLIPALILASVAAPAAAQYRGNGGGGSAGIQQQINQIEGQIRTLRQRRLISPNEAQRLSRQADGIEQRLQRYRRDGLSQRERGDLRERIQNLRERVRSERHEGRQDRRDDRRDDHRDDRRDHRR